MPRPATVRATVRNVIAVVAALAHRLQVVVGAVLWRVVEVRDGQNHQAVRPFRWLPMAFSATARARCRPMEAAFAFALALTA